MTLTNFDLRRKAKIAEFSCEWVEALFYYYELQINSNTDLYQDDIDAIELIIHSIDKGDMIRAGEPVQ